MDCIEPISNHFLPHFDQLRVIFLSESWSEASRASRNAGVTFSLDIQ